MEQNRIDLAQFNEIQLKALAYDELNKLENARNNLSILNQELAKRQINQPVMQNSQLENKSTV